MPRKKRAKKRTTKKEKTEHHEVREKGPDKLALAAIAVVVLLIAYFAYASVNIPKEAEATIDLYIMSQCPYGTLAEEEVTKAIGGFDGAVDMNLHFIGNIAENGELLSLHGPPEVAENIRQICIQKYSKPQLLDYLACVNNDYMNAELLWGTCAEQSGVNVAKVEECVSSGEGAELLAEDMKLTDSFGITGSPTIRINDEAYGGRRDSLSITTALCAGLESNAVCDALPEEPTVNMLIVNDEACSTCTELANGIEAQMSTFFSKLNVQSYDYSTTEGKALVDEVEAKRLPIILFDGTLMEHAEYQNLAPYLEEKGGLYNLRFEGAEFLGREERPGHITLFVMSQCPYGTIAEESFFKVLDKMPDLTWSVRFITTANVDKTFSSLHGQAETDENMRQACMLEIEAQERLYDYHLEKFRAYVECVNVDYQNAEALWEECAEGAGFDVANVTQCFSTEKGTSILIENAYLSGKLDIMASPTILVNNKYVLNTISAAQMQSVICEYNPGFEGCDEAVEETAPSNIPPSGSC